MANKRKSAAAKGKKSRKPDVKKNMPKAMDETESSQSESPTPDSGFSLLLDLPPELRVRIYEYAVWAEDGCLVTKTRGVPEPPPLMTSTAIRKEAIDVYYSINAIDMKIESDDMTIGSFWARKSKILRRQYGITPNHANADFEGPPSWTSLKHWIKAAHKGEKDLAEFGPVPADPTVDSTEEAKELKLVFGIISSVIAMRSRPWEEVEPIVEALRVGLTAIDDMWAST
jgi:hypothetical protein